MSGLWWLAIGGAVFAVVLIWMTPRLVLRPVLHDALLDLRDEIYDARRDGTLPYAHPAPISLIRRIEDMADILDEVTPARLFMVYRMTKTMPDAEMEAIRLQANPEVSDLSGPESVTYDHFDRRFRVMKIVTPWLTSWTGIVVLVLTAPITVVATIVSFVSRPTQQSVVNKLEEPTVYAERLAFEHSDRGGRVEVAVGV